MEADRFDQWCKKIKHLGISLSALPNFATKYRESATHALTSWSSQTSGCGTGPLGSDLTVLGTRADLSLLLDWPEPPWAASAWACWRQTWMPLQSTALPGAEGGFSDAHAVSLFIFARRPAVVVMIFISISAPFIC